MKTEAIEKAAEESHSLQHTTLLARDPEAALSDPKQKIGMGTLLAALAPQKERLASLKTALTGPLPDIARKALTASAKLLEARIKSTQKKFYKQFFPGQDVAELMGKMEEQPLSLAESQQQVSEEVATA